MSNGEECQQNLQVLHGAFHIDFLLHFRLLCLDFNYKFYVMTMKRLWKFTYYIIYMKINIYFSLFALQLLKTYLF